MLLTLYIAFLSPIFHMWNKKGIFFNLSEEGSSLSQMVVCSERVPHLVFSLRLGFFSALKVFGLKAWNLVLSGENMDYLKQRTSRKLSYRRFPLGKYLCQ